MFKKINQIIFVLCIIIAFIPNILTLFNFSPFVITSSSMEPKYPAGSLVFVSRVQKEDINCEDVITFNYSENIIITHRIKAIENGKYITQGDANNTTEGPFDYSAIIGKTSNFCIPFLGYVYSFIFNHKILLIILIFLYLFLGSALSRRIKKNNYK